MAFFAVFCLLLAAAMALLWWRAKTQREDMEQRVLLSRTEDQNLIEAARNRTELLHRLVDGIQDGLFVVNGDMRIIFMNRAIGRFFTPVTEPVGRQLIECVRDHRIVELAASAAKAGSPAQEEFLVSSPRDGRMLED